ncbi:MAG: YdcF family protein [Planctomycetaceae bacterium]|nr:YdcF family protein [Planctomycetaceae bacterium]
MEQNALPPCRNPRWRTIAQVLAFWLGIFTLINLAGELIYNRFGVNIWWIDLQQIGSGAAAAILAPAAAALIVWSLFPRMGRWRGFVTIALTMLVLAAAAINAATFYVLLWQGALHTPVPAPFSLVVATGLGFIVCAQARPTYKKYRARRWFLSAAVTAALAMALPLAQMAFFGNSDYRRKADVAVVFGAGVYPSGKCTNALADRVTAACKLYHDGYVKTLIFSGGPGMGEVHETEGMRRLAMQLGVPQSAIALDEQGLDTQRTVNNTMAIFGQSKGIQVLVVSHFYHLPRIKMAYARAGQEVYTVPATQRELLKSLPWYMLREVAALWGYYLKPGISNP